MSTFHGMVTDEPTNLGFERIDLKNASMGGERVYGGGYDAEGPQTLESGICAQFKLSAL